MANKVIEITFDVVPMGKARPRLGRHGVYTPARTAKAEKDIKAIALDYVRNHKIQPLKGALKAEIIFYFVKPKSVKNRPFPSIKPDVDNLCKLHIDSLNNILYKDDSQIIDLHAVKLYGHRFQVKMKLEEIEG